MADSDRMREINPSVEFLYKTMLERDPHKRRVKPVQPHLLQLDFAGLDNSSDDSDFKVEDARTRGGRSLRPLPRQSRPHVPRWASHRQLRSAKEPGAAAAWVLDGPYRRDAVACFASKDARKATRTLYASVEQYQKLWLPVLAIEAASSAVSNNFPAIIHNVPIAWHEENSIRGLAYVGILKLGARFCSERDFKFPLSWEKVEESASRYYDKDEEACSGYFCVRYADKTESEACSSVDPIHTPLYVGMNSNRSRILWDPYEAGDVSAKILTTEEQITPSQMTHSKPKRKHSVDSVNSPMVPGKQKSPETIEMPQATMRTLNALRDAGLLPLQDYTSVVLDTKTFGPRPKSRTQETSVDERATNRSSRVNSIPGQPRPVWSVEDEPELENDMEIGHAKVHGSKTSLKYSEDEIDDSGRSNDSGITEGQRSRRKNHFLKIDNEEHSSNA